MDELAFLSIDQILGDVAVLIHTARRHLENYSGQVFVWGSGVGGTLAILARQKFPNLIHGAWSSNGIFMPTVFATCNIIRHRPSTYLSECVLSAAPYLSIAENIREIGGEACGDRVTQAFSQIEELIASEDDTTLVEEFGICRPFNVSQYSMDIGMLSEGLINQINAFIDRYQLVDIYTAHKIQISYFFFK